MHDAGEPISRGRMAPQDTKPLEIRDVLPLVGLITGAVLFDGIAALLLIEVFKALGWLPERASEAASDAAGYVSAQLRGRAAQPG